MSKHDRPTTGESLIERQMSKSVMRAQKEITEYIRQKQKYALKDIPPENQPELRQLMADADDAVLAAFDTLKNYASKEMEEKWMEERVGTFNDQPVIFGSRNEENASDDVYYVDDLRGMTIEWEEEKHVRFEGDVVEKHSAPAMMDSIRGYQNIWSLLFKTMERAEFAPQAPMPEYRPGESEEEILTHE